MQSDGLSTEGFQVYVDNLDEYEIFMADEAEELIGTRLPCNFARRSFTLCEGQQATILS